MSAITKAVLLILIPAIYLANCAHSRNLKENREFEISSKVKKSEMISRILPNLHHYHLPRQRCGKKLVEAVQLACDNQLAQQQPSKRSSYSESQLYSLYKRTPIVDECCNKPCSLADLLKYCHHGVPKNLAEINRLHVHSTSRPAMNAPRRIIPLEVYEKNTERNLICIPQFNVGLDSDRVVDHLGNHWIRVNHSSASEQMSNVKPVPTQNITLETTESETTTTPVPVLSPVVESTANPDESDEPWGPPSSEENYFSTGYSNF